MKSLKDKIELIMNKNKGKIYSIHDFYVYGTKNTIKSILYRLEKENKIVRVLDGLYTKPFYSKLAKQIVYPDINTVAEKLADKFSWTISPTQDLALNYSGLSTQVPVVCKYISDGPSKQYKYRGRLITFIHTAKRNISPYSRKLAIMIQAIKAIGEKRVREIDIKRLAFFSRDITYDFKKIAKNIPFWILDVLIKVQKIRHNYEHISY